LTGDRNGDITEKYLKTEGIEEKHSIGDRGEVQGEVRLYDRTKNRLIVTLLTHFIDSNEPETLNG
jgi:hypothetical protein